MILDELTNNLESKDRTKEVMKEVCEKKKPVGMGRPEQMLGIDSVERSRDFFEAMQQQQQQLIQQQLRPRMTPHPFGQLGQLIF